MIFNLSKKKKKTNSRYRALTELCNFSTSCICILRFFYKDRKKQTPGLLFHVQVLRQWCPSVRRRRGAAAPACVQKSKKNLAVTQQGRWGEKGGRLSGERQEHVIYLDLIFNVGDSKQKHAVHLTGIRPGDLSCRVQSCQKRKQAKERESFI